MSAPPITLLTDFGLQDTYVAQMHGVIARIAPHVRVIDLTHGVLPQNRIQAAILLADSVPAFPAGTIHVFVVDPGVGSDRRMIAAEIGDWRFVGPDNGVLTAVLDRWPMQRAVSLTNPQYFGAQRSRTFHGRDVFSPVAAHWANGVPLTTFGAAIPDALVRLNLPQPTGGERHIDGEVLYVDRFGNLITNILGDRLPPTSAVDVTVGPHAIGPVVGCYADRPSEPMALLGSSGRVEIAVGNGSAADRLQLSAGAVVRIRW
jgi:S-adenosylmethionine hydrolase